MMYKGKGCQPSVNIFCRLLATTTQSSQSLPPILYYAALLVRMATVFFPFHRSLFVHDEGGL